MENASPIISIIMPSHNCASYLQDSVRSVQAQTYENWELLFQDDCSTDDTQILVSTMAAQDKRIKYARNEDRCGSAVARNNALRRAQGRWIAFLDSDDLWHPEKLERQLRFMTENDCAFSYTQYSEISRTGGETGVLVSGPRRVTKLGMFSFCWLGCLTVMYDREKIGLVQIADIQKNNDYAMWLKVSRKADCYLLPETLAQYRRGRVGSVSTQSYATLIKWHYKLWREAEGLSIIKALFWTSVNLVCGVWKKVYYVSKVQ